MDFRKKPHRSIDGFYTNSRLSSQPDFRRPAFSDEEEPKEAAKPIERRAAKPKLAPSYANTQGNGPSLIGMNMPIGGYAKANSQTNQPKKRKLLNFHRPWSRKRKVVSVILTIVIICLGFFGWFGSRLIGSLDKVFHGNIFSDVHALFSHSDLKESDGRVNILVAGNSADDPGHAGADLTDSIMIWSIDPTNHTGFVFSIPRDLWVYIPGLGSYQKINAAAETTNFSKAGYPKGGMGQLQQIVQQDLGIPIDYYALVNYAALKDAVDTVGGITVDINSPDPYGLYDSYTKLRLPNGEDNLDGQQALELARARCDAVVGDVCYGFPNSDFTRTMYQREEVIAILKKATSIGIVTNPLKITSLFSSFSDNVQTNLALSNVLALDNVAKGMSFSKLGSYTYSSTIAGNTNPLIMSANEGGQSALIPSAGVGDYAGLRAYWQSVASNNQVAKENASVEILNGTNVSGLAKQAQQIIESKYVVNATIGNAVGNYNTSLIVDNSGGKDPATKTLLEQIFGDKVVTSSSGSAEAEEARNYNENFVVIIGQNYANANPVDSSTTGSLTGYETSSTTSSTTY